MCNPRRIHITTTRDLAESWQQTVERSVQLSETLHAEARLKQSLSTTLGIPVLRALEARLLAGDSCWIAIDTDSYQHDVDGGYVIYDLQAQTLEIVATAMENVQASATVQRLIEGTVHTQISGEAEAQYFDNHADEREQASIAARSVAEQRTEAAAQSHLQQARREAVEAVLPALDAEACEAARTQLQINTEQQQTALQASAREQLQAVGVQCQQAFNRLLAEACRDAVLAYARRHGAEQITCDDDGNVIAIDFLLSR